MTRQWKCEATVSGTLDALSVLWRSIACCTVEYSIKQAYMAVRERYIYQQVSGTRQDRDTGETSVQEMSVAGSARSVMKLSISYCTVFAVRGIVHKLLKIARVLVSNSKHQRFTSGCSPIHDPAPRP